MIGHVANTKLLTNQNLKIAIAVCGAIDKVPTNIKKLLQWIPAIDRCDEGVKISSCLPDIRYVSYERTYSSYRQFC